MGSDLAEKIEKLEARFPRWEKWLYACYGAVFMMLAHSFIKASENTALTKALFFIESKVGTTNLPGFSQYYTNLAYVYLSPWRLLIWLIIEMAVLVPAAILAFHSAWRKIVLARRLNLIFAYLLAGWVNLLSLAVPDPRSVPDGYNTVIVVYLLAMALGYGWLRRKKNKAEEVFP
jgi:hypothetical protein